MSPKALFACFMSAGVLLIASGIYWILALFADIPGSVFLRQAFSSTSRRMGVGVEYKSGPWMVVALLFFGGMILYSLLKGRQE